MDNTPNEEPRWPELHRVRRAIVVVDVVESVRLMQQHEDDVIDRWRRFVHEVRTELLPAHGGRMVKSLGDGMLLEFAEVAQASRAARAIQRRSAALNLGRTPDAVIGLRVAIHHANVVVEDFDLLGSGVNLAARLATLAGPGEIVISADAADEVVDGVDGLLDDLGECYLKHVAAPQRCFRLSEAREAALGLPVPDDLRLRGPAIAVMPFTVTPAHESAALGQLVCEELIGRLSRSDRLQVLSHLTTRAFALRTQTPSEIAAVCGAALIVSGRVVAEGERIEVRAELCEAAHGSVCWSGRFAGQTRDLFEHDSELMGELAREVLEAIDHIQIRRVEGMPLPNLDSYALMVGGVTLMHRTAIHDFQRAREVLEHLADRHGRHPLPQAWLAKWHVLCVQQGWSSEPEVQARQAIALSQRALDADPACALASTVEGFARANILREFDDAAACYARALDHNPNDSLAWLLTGMLHAFKDEGERALAACEQARRLSPLDPLRYFYDSLTASAALTAGRYERAVELARNSLRLNRSHLSTHRALTAALALAGRTEEAAAAARELLARDPAFTVRDFLSRTPGQAFKASQRVAHGLRLAGLPG